MIKSVVILGSTGSIGRQTLEVCAEQKIPVTGLCCLKNIDLLKRQMEQFSPKAVAVFDQEAAKELRATTTGIPIFDGMEGILRLSTMEDADCVITAMVGSIGLRPTLAAIEHGKRIGLANKETLVCAGSIVMNAVRNYGAEIVPVDSEHSAIFQCLQGCKNPKDEVEKLILTCSGGPFFGMSKDQLFHVKANDALKHPNWTMGSKITIDSATLMNKGLEVIEAMHLYQMPLSKVQAIIHRQSIIHSMVEFKDGAVLAQLGVPNMKLPIQYALTYPSRMPMQDEKLDFLSCPSLTFNPIDDAVFRLYGIARQCAEKEDTSCAIMNAANEEAVYFFLRGEIGFLDIANYVDQALNHIPTVSKPSLDDILDADTKTRMYFKETQ